MKEKKTGLIITIIILLIALLGSIGYIVYDEFIKEEEKCTCPKQECKEKETEIKEEKEEEDSITSAEIIEMYKDYMYEKEYAKKNEIQTWNFNEVVYKGYYKSDENAKYYTITGTFSCVDDSFSCIYQEQTDDEINGEMTFDSGMILIAVNEKNEYFIKEIGGYFTYDDSFIEVNESIN